MEEKRKFLFKEMMSIQKETDKEKKKQMLKDTQIFLYSKLDLSLVCLVLCTEGILKLDNVPCFQQLHVTRFEEAYEYAKLIIDQDSRIVSEFAEKVFVLGTFALLQTQVDLVCDYCGREIVNLCFTDSKVFDGSPDKVKSMVILCPEHGKKSETTKNIFYTMLTAEEMQKQFENAEKAVETWKKQTK
jgi:hypothetical protein